jgi:hypothetical protein
MTIDADEWQAFYERSRQVMGSAWAATLVKAIPPAGADALATKADLAALEERFGLRLTTGLAELRGELRTEMAELRTEMAELRGDLRTDIAGLRGEIEEKLRAQTWRLSGLLVGTLGIGITLARLA